MLSLKEWFHNSETSGKLLITAIWMYVLSQLRSRILNLELKSSLNSLDPILLRQEYIFLNL